VPHLTERLGLFVLIVLGEGLVQVIHAASEAEWNRSLAITGAGAFALMFGLWAVAVRFGYAGVALLPEQALSPRLSWPAHLLATLALATIAPVVGGLVSQPHSDVSDHTTWILLTAYAGYAVLSAGILLACGERAAAARAGLALGAASVAVAVLDLRSEAVVWVLAAGVLVAVQQRARDEASSARNT
jgi:low temperature requirement protein LtrA